MKQSISFKIWAGLITLYFVWGSTYLAIRFVVEAVPPMMTSGVRTLLAGSMLYGFGRFFGKNFVAPTKAQWWFAVRTGLLMITAGNGFVTIAASFVPSGLSALTGALVPVWLVLMQWFLDKKRPNYRILMGVVVGIVGVSLLLNLSHLALNGQEAYFGWGMLMLLLAGLTWSSGVMMTARVNTPLSPATMSGMQLIAGGTASLVISALLGEFAEVQVAAIGLKPVLSFLYLLSFGSLLGFSVFGWLTQQADPALVSTYTYVNPLVAIVLGFVLAGESLNPQMLFAASLIVGAVVLITAGKRRERLMGESAS